MSALTALGIPSLLGGLIHARSRNKKLIAEAAHLDTEDVRIISDSAMRLLAPLRERVTELEQECSDLRSKVSDLSREVEQQRQIIRTSTVQLEAANRRADYYQRAFDERADS